MSSPDVYREVSYEYLMRLVRRYKPSSLLPRLAALAASHVPHDSWLNNPKGFFITPWTIAKLAELSLVLGKEHRPGADLSDLRECCEAYLNVTDPDLTLSSGLEGAQRAMIRMCFEQLPYRLDPFRELAR